jgi:preprotein translocase subunit SecE
MNVAVNLEPVREAAGSRFERMRLFLSEVRNELKRVTWPSQAEVYATTVVVILVSLFFGLYLFTIDIVFQNLVAWIFSRFGVA